MNKPVSVRGFLIVLLLLVGLGATVLFVSQRGTGLFELRQRASSPSGIATLEMNTQSMDRYVGDVFPVRVMLNTGGIPISGVAFRFSYPFAGTVPELEVVDSDPATPGVQIQSNAEVLGLSMNVNSVILQPETNGSVFIDFSATTTAVAGYQNTAGQAIATIYFKANKPKVVNINHDPARSKITRKSDSLDVLQTIPTKVFTILADTAAPTVSITSGLVNGSTATSSAVTFTWLGTDNPARASDAVSVLGYSYQFDAEAYSAFSAGTSITRNLVHGAHTFRVRARDASGNVSTPVSLTSIRSFTLDLTPKITGLSIDHATIGTPITITGFNFGATKQIVKFGAVVVAAANITSWTDTQIVAKVPAGGDGNITVTVGTRVSGPVAFTLDTVLRLFFGYQGIGVDRGTKKVTVVVKRAGTTYVSKFENIDAVFNATEGAYEVTTPPLTRPVPTATNYTASIVDSGHLRRRFINTPMTLGTLNVLKKKTDAERLVVADFNSDNKLDIDDFGLLLAQITDLSVPVSTANAKFDANGDGVLDIVDISLLLSNYTALEILGDAE